MAFVLGMGEQEVVQIGTKLCCLVPTFNVTIMVRYRIYFIRYRHP